MVQAFLCQKGTHIEFTSIERLYYQPRLSFVVHNYNNNPILMSTYFSLFPEALFIASRDRLDSCTKDIGRLLHLRTESTKLARFNRNRVL